MTDASPTPSPGSSAELRAAALRLELARRSGLRFDDARWQRLLPELHQHIKDGASADELITLLTVGTTALFRDPPWFDAISTAVLPPFATRPMRIWSAGCATGEELISLALLRRHHNADTLLGTDLCASRIALAREGWLPVAEGDPRLAGLLREGRRMRLPEELRRRLRFGVRDLVAERAPEGAWDLILCRNVLIYLESAAQRRVLEELRGALAEEGWLVTAPAETLLEHRDLFEPVFVGEAFLFRGR